MRRLIATEFVSLDGVMEAPGGEPGYAHSGWVGTYFSDALGQYRFEEQDAAEVLLLGRVTYASFYGAWPSREGPMADKINTMRKVVVSRSLGSSPWTNTEVAGGDPIAAVNALKAESGGDILLVGSRTLAQALLLAGLVDELHLQVFPVMLASGRRLYPESADKSPLELIAAKPLPNGVVAMEYRAGNR